MQAENVLSCSEEPSTVRILSQMNPIDSTHRVPLIHFHITLPPVYVFRAVSFLQAFLSESYTHSLAWGTMPEFVRWGPKTLVRISNLRTQRFPTMKQDCLPLGLLIRLYIIVALSADYIHESGSPSPEESTSSVFCRNSLAPMRDICYKSCPTFGCSSDWMSWCSFCRHPERRCWCSARRTTLLPLCRTPWASAPAACTCAPGSLSCARSPLSAATVKPHNL